MTPVNAQIPTTEESPVVQVIDWGHQETSHCLNQCWIRGPFHEGFSVMIQIRGEIFCFRVTATIGYHIATKLYTCHDSTAVVPCAKFDSDHFHKKIPTKAEWNFHQTGISMDQLFAANGPKICVAIRRHYATMWHGASGGTIWQHRTRLTLFQLIPCYLTTPIHYLN